MHEVWVFPLGYYYIRPHVGCVEAIQIDQVAGKSVPLCSKMSMLLFGFRGQRKSLDSAKHLSSNLLYCGRSFSRASHRWSPSAQHQRRASRKPHRQRPPVPLGKAMSSLLQDRHHRQARLQQLLHTRCASTASTCHTCSGNRPYQMAKSSWKWATETTCRSDGSQSL